MGGQVQGGRVGVGDAGDTGAVGAEVSQVDHVHFEGSKRVWRTLVAQWPDCVCHFGMD